MSAPVSTTRCRLAAVQVKSALTTLRQNLNETVARDHDHVVALSTIASIDDDLALLEKAIGIVRREAERLGWLRACAHLGLGDVSSAVAWELAGATVPRVGEAVAEREVAP